MNVAPALKTFLQKYFVQLPLTFNKLKGFKDLIGNSQVKRLCIIFLFLGMSVIALLILGVKVKAGNLNPSASPAASGYTLTDIYNRLTTNATATEADHLFVPSASPASSFYTLKQIYDAIPTIDASKVKLGTTYLGVSGTLSPYPNTPSGISGLNQSVCTSAGWTWVADSDYDGLNDDPICVQPSRDSAGAKVWNTSVANDNTFIGNYGCSGDPDGDGVGTLNTSLTGTVVEIDGFGDDANTALAIADCKDGIRNLLTSAEVTSFGYSTPDTTCDSSGDNCYDGPLTPKALLEWKGTRLPTYNDFFGACGDGTTSQTAGYYGVQIGRTDNVITTNAGSWEWFSEQYNASAVRRGGIYGCSYFGNSSGSNSFGFRAVFRP